MNEFERHDRSTAVTAFFFAWIPDLLIAWGAMKLTDGEVSTFWWVFLGIQLVTFLLWLKRATWNWVVWRIWARGRLVERTKLILKGSGLPKPHNVDCSAETYFDELKNSPSQPTEVRIAAAQSEMAVLSGAANGFISAFRTHQVWDMALTEWGKT